MTIQSRHKFIEEELAASAEVKRRTYDQCAEGIVRAAELMLAALRAQRKILLCGNGGSAADCQHLATELVIRMDPQIKRPGIPAIALTTDSSMLTAGANDIGYDAVFARAVEALGASGDVLISISTSGRSANIDNAVRCARGKHMATVGLLGKGGGSTKDLVDVAIIVPSNDTQRIQESHITIGHILCGIIERELYG